MKYLVFIALVACKGQSLSVQEIPDFKSSKFYNMSYITDNLFEDRDLQNAIYQFEKNNNVNIDDSSIRYAESEDDFQYIGDNKQNVGGCKGIGRLIIDKQQWAKLEGDEKKKIIHYLLVLCFLKKSNKSICSDSGCEINDTSSNYNPKGAY